MTDDIFTDVQTTPEPVPDTEYGDDFSDVPDYSQVIDETPRNSAETPPPADALPSPVPEEGTDGLPEEETSGTDETVAPDVTPAPVVSYEDYLAGVTAQTEELVAIKEVLAKEQEYLETYQNMGTVLIYGIGLLFGVVCALIISNYLKH